MFLTLLILIFVIFFWYISFWTPGESTEHISLPYTREELELVPHLKAIVYKLANEIGPRNEMYYSALRDSAHFIREAFIKAGYTPIWQTYEVSGLEYFNIEAVLRGQKEPEKSLVIGAHYDTYMNTPGADDNASGVAILLELARLLRTYEPRITIRFVAFTLEEPPSFGSSFMGSYVYAREAFQRGEDIVFMMSLECVGYFVEQRGSQYYPPFIRFLFPDTGNFLAFVSRPKDRAVLHRLIGAFRNLGNFPAEGAKLPPRFVPGVDWSDHLNFWQFGFPALMVTDTAFYRNPHYHRVTDRPETLNYEAMARITWNFVKILKEFTR